METIKEELDDIYEEILIGFILELKEQNLNGREIGKELARITQIMEVWEK